MQITRRTLLWLTVSAGYAGSVGCSGSGGVSAPTGVIFTLDWPDASRALPLRARSVQVVIKQGTKTLATQLYPVGPDSEQQITELPFATALTLEAAAYANEDGTGQLLALASIPFSTLKGKLQRVSLTLASVVQSVAIGFTSGTTEQLFTATARDSAGAAVLTDPAQWLWEGANSALGTLTTDGPTARLRESGFGVLTLKATEKESGVWASYAHPVCVGSPTTASPALARFPLAGPLTGLIALGTGRFALVHGSTLTCVDGSATTIWQRTLPSAGGTLKRLGTDSLAVTTSAGMRVHSLSSGALQWEQAGVAPAIANTTAVFIQRPATESSPATLEAYALNDGTFLWQKTVATARLVFADATRLVSLDSASGLYAVFQSTLGNLIWSSSVPTGSQFLGLQTDVSPPVLLSFAPGEVRALALSNGVRSWVIAATGESAYHNAGGQQVVVYGSQTAAGFAAGTGAPLWSKSALREVSGSRESGPLVYLPTVTDLTRQPLQQVSAAGALLWQQYLPQTALPDDRFVPRTVGDLVIVTLKNAESYESAPLFALDATTGSYRWRTEQSLKGALVASGDALALAPASGTGELVLLR